METTEKIVEAYCRYIRHFFTLPNIRCGGQHEIDLLAVDPVEGHIPSRYHIECGVSISGAFSKLTAKDFSPERYLTRVGQPGQRRTLGYFLNRKFTSPDVLKTLAEYGFQRGNYQRVIVSWGFAKDVSPLAVAGGVELWDFRKLLREIAENFHNRNSYFTDDTLRTLQLFSKAASEHSSDSGK
ncbi:MAG: hypothetical protein ACHQQS_14120 [Thermoanaerobaculales bacterium]